MSQKSHLRNAKFEIWIFLDCALDIWKKITLQWDCLANVDKCTLGYPFCVTCSFRVLARPLCNKRSSITSKITKIKQVLLGSLKNSYEPTPKVETKWLNQKKKKKTQKTDCYPWVLINLKCCIIRIVGHQLWLI